MLNQKKKRKKTNIQTTIINVKKIIAFVLEQDVRER